MAKKVRSWAGLDVHSAKVVACVVDAESGEMSVHRLPGDTAKVVAFCAGLPGPTRVAYEAGPTGFGLARTGRRRGIDVRVVAPGSIPKGPGDRVKTDSRDAVRLVRLLAAGELTFAFVPTEEDESFRDLIRCIEDLRGDLMRARHRLSKFLLRRGHRYQDGGAWTPRHSRWLRSLSFDGSAQATFADYCASVELLAGRRATLLVTLEQTAPGCSHAQTIGRLRCFRGIETLTAAGLCAETGGFERFPRPTLLSGFLGIVPSERTSDQKRRQGAITRARLPARPPAAGRSRPALPQAASDHPHPHPPPGRPGPASDRDRLARPATPAPALAAPPRRAAKARRRGRDRRRARARRIPLGGRHPRCLTAAPPTTAPGRCRGAHEHPGRPSTVARGSRVHYGQPAPAGRARI